VPVITVHETASRWCPVIEAYVLMSMVESATGILIFDLSLFSALCRIGSSGNRIQFFT